MTNNIFYDNILDSQAAVFTVGSTAEFYFVNNSFKNESIISSGVLIKLTTTKVINIDSLNLTNIHYKTSGL